MDEEKKYSLEKYRKMKVVPTRLSYEEKYSSKPYKAKFTTKKENITIKRHFLEKLLFGIKRYWSLIPLKYKNDKEYPPICNEIEEILNENS